MIMRKLTALSLLLFFVPVAQAFENEGLYGYSEIPAPLTPKNPNYVSIVERVDKFNNALKSLSIPLEERPEILNTLPVNGAANASDVRRNLEFIDGFKALREYFFQDEGSIALYQDFYRPTLSSKYQEAFVTLNTSAPSNDSKDLMEDLAAIARQAGTDQPLRGLNVAIDPGHMGGKYWDAQTGKFVKAAVNGKLVKVSEGMLNLYTAYLLKNALSDLGAQVMLTHEGVNAVSPLNIDNFDKTHFRNLYIYSLMDSFMSGFFQLTNSDFIQKLAAKVKEIDQNTMFHRDQFFVRGEDLKSRIEKINDFKPHVTIDIHYDASNVDAVQSKTNNVKAYVAGALLNNDVNNPSSPSRETGSRLAKAYAFKHLLEPNRWNNSVKLASSLVSQLSKSIDVPLLKNPAGGTIKVTDGVFSRNLYMTLHSTQGLLVYLEVLHYDYVDPTDAKRKYPVSRKSEFPRLAKLDRVGSYNGNNFSYPSRLDEVVAGLKNGMLQYFSQMR